MTVIWGSGLWASFGGGATAWRGSEDRVKKKQQQQQKNKKTGDEVIAEKLQEENTIRVSVFEARI